MVDVILRDLDPDSLRARAGRWIESSRTQYAIIALIIVNAVILGLETSGTVMAHMGPFLIGADRIILGVFVVEIAVKLFAYRLRFFSVAWNVFDFVVVAIALIPASGPLAVLRALRVLRVLRLISMVPKLRFIVEALLHAVPGIASIAGLMLLLFYVFAVMATGLFGDSFPEWFGSIGASMYTLFQIMTLESWSMGIVRPVMEQYPHAWLFFVPFILIATFTMLNLFIGIIVDTMQTMHEADHARDRGEIEETIHQEGGAIEEEIRALRNDIRALRTTLASEQANPDNNRVD
ncbi:ion transporter [Thiohalophilus thiocyanatoxydans]|uniref:Voltage-gated sodium channel n=1 Tax=Thiohalophilus thiocyanatoxydans TaxID=381308 RepID=A0A4R8IIQ3_9GAMM|nr:ion transporter [Thiohalophilus thiocyanatoxydans]TDY00552.1 voltage-gated sodium channel [Thiohalophilus thiocyanatoxydans]